MTEDEAFIRAIVDNPGDDLPRLVYADWLDDRSDPRGPYLRAERETVATGDIARLRELAVGLDPVWVARVSRPPVGVCCDHVRFEERGPVLGAAGIDQVELRLGGRFSEDFRAFLLNYNGGTPVPADLPYPAAAGAGWEDMTLEISKIYTASRPNEIPPDDANDLWGFEFESERNWLEELYRMGDDQGPNALIADMVPFADSIHDLGYLFVGTGEANRGRVFYFRDYCHFSDDPGHLFDYSDTFAQFLACICSPRDS